MPQAPCASPLAALSNFSNDSSQYVSIGNGTDSCIFVKCNETASQQSTVGSPRRIIISEPLCQSCNWISEACTVLNLIRQHPQCEDGAGPNKQCIVGSNESRYAEIVNPQLKHIFHGGKKLHKKQNFVSQRNERNRSPDCSWLSVFHGIETACICSFAPFNKSS